MPYRKSRCWFLAVVELQVLFPRERKAKRINSSRAAPVRTHHFKQKVNPLYKSDVDNNGDIMHACQVAQLSLALWDPMNCSPPDSSVHGILQTRILEWGAMPASRVSSQPRDRTCLSYVSCTSKWVLYLWCHLGSKNFVILWYKQNGRAAKSLIARTRKRTRKRSSLGSVNSGE